MTVGYSGLRKAGIEINGAGAKEWASLVGAFFINMGNAELQTYKWLTWIGGDKFEKAKNQDFEFRIGLIYGFVNEQIKEETELKIVRALLGRIKQIYSLRNVIAHNPLAMKQLPEGSWQVMIPNIRDLSNSPVVPGLLKEDFSKAIDDLISSILGLEGIFIGVIRDRDGVEPNI
ncbi:MAG: hypothetical protein JWO30_3376 [Fibrobacteres bacterium]|nr:hypothetical protein [Fibrobacterota bacterium]